MVHAQGALAHLSKPSSFYLANLCGGNKQKMVCAVLAMHCAQEKRKKKSPSDYGKSRHHPYLITGAKRTTRGCLSYSISSSHVTCSFHPSLQRCSAAFPPLRRCHHCWWRRDGKRAANLIKVIGMTDATRVIRSPDNYLQHHPGYTEQERCRAFLQEPRGGTQKNLPPIKLSTRSPNKAICVGKHMHYSSFRRDSDGGTSPSLPRSETVARGWGGGDKREAGFHNLFCLVNNVPQNQ